MCNFLRPFTHFGHIKKKKFETEGQTVKPYTHHGSELDMKVGCAILL